MLARSAQEERNQTSQAIDWNDGHREHNCARSRSVSKHEFPLLDAKFKGDQYETLIIWLRTPVEKSGGIGSNETHFSEAVEQGQKDFVSATVLGTIDNLRGVDGVLSRRSARWINTSSATAGPLCERGSHAHAFINEVR